MQSPVVKQRNIDIDTVKGFGEEWSWFDQSALSETELREGFERYFHIFPWGSLPSNAVGFDMGRGVGVLDRSLKAYSRIADLGFCRTLG